MNYNGPKEPGYQEAIGRIAFEIASESLIQQKSDLKNLRNQASFVAAINGLVASFLSGFVFDLSKLRENPSNFDAVFLTMNVPTLLAMTSFVVSLIFAIRIILPFPGWKFDLKTHEMIDGLNAKPRDYELADAYVNLAKQRRNHFIDNEKLLSITQRDLFWALVLGFAQIPFWLFNLI